MKHIKLFKESTTLNIKFVNTDEVKHLMTNPEGFTRNELALFSDLYKNGIISEFETHPEVDNYIRFYVDVNDELEWINPFSNKRSAIVVRKFEDEYYVLSNTHNIDGYNGKYKVLIDGKSTFYKIREIISYLREIKYIL